MLGGVLRLLLVSLLFCSSGAFGTATTTISGPYRYPTQSAFDNMTGVVLDDGKAYLNDVAIGVTAHVSKVSDGDRWKYEIYHEDGTVYSPAALTFRADYNGGKDCFIGTVVFGQPIVDCGATSIWYTVAYQTWCKKPGPWKVDVRYIPGDGSPEQLFENVVPIVSTGPQVKVRASPNRIRPQVIGGGGIPNLSPGNTEITVSVTESGCPGLPVADAEIEIETLTVPGSGGHTHMKEQAGTGTFPSGTAIDSGKTDSGGNFQVKYTAGVVGLQERILVTARKDIAARGEPPNIVKSSGEAALAIAIPNLVPLLPSDNYEIYQSDAGKEAHLENNYGTPGLIIILWSVGGLWVDQQIASGVDPESVVKLSVNDMSLPNGGVFELCQSLKADCSHKSHEVGVDVDINAGTRMALDAAQIEALKKLFESHDPACRFIHNYHFRCEPVLTVK